MNYVPDMILIIQKPNAANIEGSNVVMLEPDIAKVFKDSESVNDALRSMLDFTKTTEKLTKRSKKKVSQ